MQCIACAVTERPPPAEDGTGAAFLLGFAYGYTPGVARAEVRESLCDKHRRELEEISAASNESLMKLLTTLRQTYKASPNAPGERKLLVNTASDHLIEFRR